MYLQTTSIKNSLQWKKISFNSTYQLFAGTPNHLGHLLIVSTPKCASQRHGFLCHASNVDARFATHLTFFDTAGVQPSPCQKTTAWKFGEPFQTHQYKVKSTKSVHDSQTTKHARFRKIGIHAVPLQKLEGFATPRILPSKKNYKYQNIGEESEGHEAAPFHQG